jgi:hypothetical protein
MGCPACVAKHLASRAHRRANGVGPSTREAYGVLVGAMVAIDDLRSTKARIRHVM